MSLPSRATANSLSVYERALLFCYQSNTSRNSACTYDRGGIYFRISVMTVFLSRLLKQ